MPKKTERKSSVARTRPVDLNCPFCKGKLTPSYKDYHTLEKYITDRAKIVGKRRTGLCAKHQRRLSIEIKRARHLGLLPFSGSI